MLDQELETAGVGATGCVTPKHYLVKWVNGCVVYIRSRVILICCVCLLSNVEFWMLGLLLNKEQGRPRVSKD